MKKWKVKVLHLSHTDIGYTDTQEHIIGGQITNLRNIVANYSKIVENSEYKEWHWICESFYIVERFLRQASEEEIKIFSELVKKGVISLSASYLNLCELASETLYGNILERSAALAKKNSWRFDSAVCDDVNGMSVVYGKQLVKHGVKHLYFGLHTHHGFYPAWKKQSPFWWKHGGKKILVWIGEHYMLGNEIGLIEGSMGDYILQSDFKKGHFSLEEQITEGATRLVAYLNQLEKDDYPFDVVPITVLGANIDNAPANFDIRLRVEKFNKEFKKRNLNIELEMVGLGDFFDNFALNSAGIPTYSGDWPDWWSDGVGSTPQSTRLFREAQRIYELICKLNIESDLLVRLEEKLILYAEHTWGGWSSIENPFSLWQQELLGVKKAYAAEAFTLAQEIIGKRFGLPPHRAKGEEVVSLDFLFPWEGSQKIPVLINPHLHYQEASDFAKGVKIHQDGKLIPSLLVPRNYSSDIYALVVPKKSTKISLASDFNDVRPMTRMFSIKAADGVSDVHNVLDGSKVRVSKNQLDTSFISLKWSERGIESLILKNGNEELIDPTQEPLFCPVYEAGLNENYPERMNNNRRLAGRNHRTYDMTKSVGKLFETRVATDLPGLTEIELFYTLPGTKLYKVSISVFDEAKVIKASVKIIKDSSWAPENLFVSLPFTNGSVIKIDKGDPVEIWKEQIPGSLIDYYCSQSGAEITTLNKARILLASPDSPLFWTGPMRVEKRFLAHDKRNPNEPVLYSWVMNSMWETNFSTELGGFHEFNYVLAFGRNGETSSELKTLCNSFFVNRK